VQTLTSSATGSTTSSPNLSSSPSLMSICIGSSFARDCKCTRVRETEQIGYGFCIQAVTFPSGLGRCQLHHHPGKPTGCRQSSRV
jgi:hypothetical protein